MQTSQHLVNNQRGAATLLITLVLTMSISIVTLAVARTQLVEQRISANENWNTRLSLEAESGLARGTVLLVNTFETLSWSKASDSNSETSRLNLENNQTDTGTELMLKRASDYDRMISIQAITRRTDGSNNLARVSQFVRLLSVLTPLAESIPPLVINGCLTGMSGTIDIRPLDADTVQAGNSGWIDTSKKCSIPGLVDTHNGVLETINMAEGLWPLIFSVSTKEFISLAEEDASFLNRNRRYWVAQASGSGSNIGSRQFGSIRYPVVLYFPAETGCPVFSPGTTIYGVVFIESSCSKPIAGYNISIIGSLIVNGNLDITSSSMQLNNIQVVDSRQTRLDFPILRGVLVPGTWKDFQP